MENNQNQNELSFEELVSMSTFELNENAPKEEQFNLEEEKPENKDGEKTQEELDEEARLKEEADALEAKNKEVKPKAEKKEVTNVTDYSELVKDKLDSGDWEDVVVEIDGEEKKLSELESLDKETFKEIEKTILEEKQKIFDEKYVDVDGLSETQIALINIVKNGDLNKAEELFKNPQALQEPFQGYDPESDEHNQQVLQFFYQSKGHSPSQIKLLIEDDIKELVADKKAQQVVDFQKKAFKENLEKTNKTLLEEKQKEDNEIKEYRKTLSAELKAENLGETAIRKFVDSATKKDKTGGFEIDSVYENLMKDPKQAKDLIYFMLDKENFVKKLTAETKKNVNVENLRKIKILSDTTKNKQQKELEDKPVADNVLSRMVFD